MALWFYGVRIIERGTFWDVLAVEYVSCSRYTSLWNTDSVKIFGFFRFFLFLGVGGRGGEAGVVQAA